MRALLTIILFITAIVLPWYVFFIAALVYAFRYFALELVLVAFCIDVYFGTTFVPYYTLGTLVILLVLEWYKANSSFYSA